MDIDEFMAGRAAIRAPRSRRHAASALKAAGRITALLPGTFVRAGTLALPAVRAEAICAYDPRAVLTGAAAAAVDLRPGVWPAVLTFTSPRRWTISAAWFAHTHGGIDPSHVRLEPVPHTDPAMTGLVLSSTEGPRPVHQLLRERRATPDELLVAARAMARQRGNAQRRRLAEDCRASPWSDPEACCHRLLRRAGITGWRGNVPVHVEGERYVLDIAFGAQRVALEVDSWTFHGSREAFEADRLRHNRLEAAGWLVLHVTPDMLEDRPHELVRWVRRALGDRRP